MASPGPANRAEIGFQPLGWPVPSALFLSLAALALTLVHYHSFAAILTYLEILAGLAAAGLLYEFCRVALQARHGHGYRIAAWPFYLSTLVWASWFIYSLLDEPLGIQPQFRLPAGLLFASFLLLSIGATWKVQAPVLRRH